MNQDIPRKANRVLNIILLSLLLILVRVWYLAVIQHEEEVQNAYKPKRRVIMEPAERATIRDRFNIPLALNKIQYNAAVCYSHIREMPAVGWEKDEKGKMIKIPLRMRYISRLASLLAQELNMEAEEIEDTIHGKASLFPHTPFVLKEELSEEQYFRLKTLERDWPGIQMQRLAKRFYPQGKTACDVLGFLGPISQKKYYQIAEEIQLLESYLAARERNEVTFLPPGFQDPLQVRERLLELQEKAYTINDLVGKAGIEAQYEEILRGQYGKKIFEVDVKGNFLRELPGSHSPVNGREIVLTLSSELQQFAEQLLAADELRTLNEMPPKLDENWMRGGAIVAMVPQTGEVVALASYPRFDPNAFIPSKDPELKKEKEKKVQGYLENETYIGEIWDGKRALERELYSFVKGRYEKEEFWLTWINFLETILPAHSPVTAALLNVETIKMACDIQVEGTSHPFLREIPLEEDRLLALNLLKLAVPVDLLPTEILPAVGAQKIRDYHVLKQAGLRMQAVMKTHVQQLYHTTDFALWRKTYFKEYLKRMRKEEKAAKKHALPYTVYLERVEKKLFHAFWNTYKPYFLYTALSGHSPIVLEKHPTLHPYLTHLSTLFQEYSQKDSLLASLQTILASLSPEEGLKYLQSFRSFDELKTPSEKNLAAAFYPRTGYGFGLSKAFRQVHPQGSVFKLVTAYQALLERFFQKIQNPSLDLNPLTLIDQIKGDRAKTSPSQIIGYTLDGKPIPRLYKGGMLPRSSHGNMGKVDLVGALEQSSNLYFSILANEYIENPQNLANAALELGYGRKTGLDLPGENKGNIPSDLENNKSGLYSFAIGQHSLVVTPVQTAVMVSTLANQGKVIRPKLVKLTRGKEAIQEEDALFSADRFSFQDALSLVGIHFPLFTATRHNLHEEAVDYTPTTIERTLPFPKEVAQMITKGMRQSVIGARGSSRPAIMRKSYDHPRSLHDYFEVHENLLAKTGTAQILYKQTVDTESKAQMRTHVWFSAIAYPDSRFEEPELVVIVLLRYRHSGREGGPMAAQVIKKWRELKAKHEEKGNITS